MPDGVYDVLLTAIDNAGNQGQCTMNLRVENPVDDTPPTVTGEITPDEVQLIDGYFPFDSQLKITALSDPDTVSVTTQITDQLFNMTRQDDGTWILYYATNCPLVDGVNSCVLLPGILQEMKQLLFSISLW